MADRWMGGIGSYTRTMSSYLGRLIEYNTWATGGLLEFLGDQPSGALDLTTAGVYGSIRETLGHMLSSELSYTRRLIARDAIARPEPVVGPDLEMLRQMAAESADTLAELMRSLPEPDLRIQLRDGKRSAATMLTQLVMHGVEHRTHVGTILGANGIEPPDLDSWAHGIWAWGDDWPSDWGRDVRES